MNIKNITTMAFRYLSGHYRRFIFLIIAVGFGFAIITTMTALYEGMYRNVYRAARQHYGGQLFVLGFHKQYGNMELIRDDKTILQAIETLNKKPIRMVKRTLFFADGILYFAGNSSRQKYVYGVDWDIEKEEFAKLDYAYGSSAGMTGTNGILISLPVAKQIKAKIGDDIILKVRTKTGQSNTGTFIVRGIIRDESIFGYYKCFVDRRYLNSLLGLEKSDYSSLGLYYGKSVDIGKQAALLYTQLAKKLPMAPMIHTKEEYSFQLEQHWKGIRYFVMTLQIFVSQVADLLTAMERISYFLYIIIGIIVLVSISVTYKLIIHERMSEIGTMRAIGLQRSDILKILITEALFIFIISVVLGGVVSLLILWIISFFSFSFIPGFDIFMYKGRLLPYFTFNDIVTNIVLLAAIISPALWIPSFRASRLKLTIALSGDK